MGAFSLIVVINLLNRFYGVLSQDRIHPANSEEFYLTLNNFLQNTLFNSASDNQFNPNLR